MRGEGRGVFEAPEGGRRTVGSCDGGAPALPLTGPRLVGTVQQVHFIRAFSGAHGLRHTAVKES